MAKGIMVNYQDKEITTAIYEQQIWFSYIDVQKIIDIDSIGLYPEESANLNIDGKYMQMISEFCVYRLSALIYSDEAQYFRKWLVGDVIYRLRKYGCYKLSIAEQKEKIINEIIELGGNGSEIEKMKYFSLDKLKLEKSLLEKMRETHKKEKDIMSKRTAIKKDFPFFCDDLEEEYDIHLAITNLIYCKANLDEYRVCLSDNECWFNEKFVEYLKNGGYKW